MRFPTNASIASTTRWRCRSTGHDVVAVLQHHHFDGALQAVPQTRCIFQRRVIVLERMQDQGGLAHIGTSFCIALTKWRCSKTAPSGVTGRPASDTRERRAL